MQINDVRDFAVVSFVPEVSFVSCYFGTKETRETIGTGTRSGIRGRALSALSLPGALHCRAVKCCPRLRCRLFRLFRLFRLSGLLLFWDERDKRDDRDGSEDEYRRCHCRVLRTAVQINDVRDFAFVSFVSFVSRVSCYFETRGTRETIGTGARSGISPRCRCLALRTVCATASAKKSLQQPVADLSGGGGN